MLRQSRNMDINKGPKMTPIKPKSDKPITTPKMVINGCMSAIFFCNMKRARLSTFVMTISAKAASIMAFTQ